MRDRIQYASGALTRIALVAGLSTLLAPSTAQAAFLHGEALDTMADYIAWGVLVIAPIVCIGVFWLVHIIPEKVAEKKKHPQAKAIQTLCLLSLVFGGLLWPFAMLWAFTKPVLHKAAYGTDVWDEEEHGGVRKEPEPASTGRVERHPVAPGARVEPIPGELEAMETGPRPHAARQRG